MKKPHAFLAVGIAVAAITAAIVVTSVLLTSKNNHQASEAGVLSTYTCPSIKDPPRILDTKGGERVTFPILDDDLCTLWRIGPQEYRRLPLARSYQGHDWEVYAGEFSDKIQFDCGTATTTICTTTTLPILEADQRYELVSFTHELSETDQIARFLEQATFGPTRKTIDAFPGYVGWIKEQISLPYTSHRRSYRTRLNHRKTTTSSQGVATQPCKKGTRYRKYAFTHKDKGTLLEIRTDPVTSRKVLLRDGQARTVLPHTELYQGTRRELLEDGFYEIQRVLDPRLGSRWRILSSAGKFETIRTPNNSALGNPPVFFDDQTPPTNPTVNLDGKAVVIDRQYYPARETDQELILQSDLEDNVCKSAPPVTGWPTYEVVGILKGEYYIHDPRWSIYENSIESPKPDGGGALSRQVEASGRKSLLRTSCGNPLMNFLNEKGCYLSDDPDVCSVTNELDEGSVVTTRIKLNGDTFRLLYEFTRGARVVYSVNGLRQNELGLPYNPPCTPSTRSRWVPVGYINGCSEASPGIATISTFVTLIEESRDTNPHVRDVFTPSIGNICDAADVEKLDFQVLVGNQCWQNVHQDHLQVFDFSAWVNAHPGGAAAIRSFAEVSGTFVLAFPDWHPMSRWHEDGRDFRQSVGRLGDTVQLRLPAALAKFIDGEVVGSENAQQSPPSGVVCGSPEEVGNDPFLFGSIRRGAFDAATPLNQTSFDADLGQQKLNIWMSAALNAPDQLRQKIAWALAQLLVISPSGVLATQKEITETFLAYYDVFVRHAFGSYRDILKEVTFSPLMGEMLSYVDSRSTAYIWQTERKLAYADENFAREVMQLFSIGLYKMYTNGTRILDSSGQIMRTYTNNEISEYARLYTGFKRQTRRGNIESAIRGSNMNPIDPMAIDVDLRDTLPKLGLDSQYVGDGLPLCTDLPSGHFLKKGAIYRLLGSSPIPKMLREPASWLGNSAVSRLRIAEASELYEKFCNRQTSSSGTCLFKGVVELDEHMTCSGSLCDIESPRVVEIGRGVYYEYVHPPCARLAFFAEGKIIRKYREEFFCENPSIHEGAAGCCTTGNSQARIFDVFTGERMNFEAAQKRCVSKSLGLCLDLPSECSRSNSCDESVGYWISGSCSLQVKIDLDGRVAIVHFLPSQIPKSNIEASVREDTKSFFRVEWSGPIDQVLADYESQCSRLGCTRDNSDNFCLCPTAVSDEQAFSKSPSREEVLHLPIGAFSQDLNGEWLRKELGNGVTMYSETGNLSPDSIFEVMSDIGVVIRRKNIRSQVLVGTRDSVQLSFRNPPHIISITNPEPRDVYYEADAGLDHYFYHPNLAPFLAIRFSQRFGVSNPSPRYVKEIATAFRTGTYVHDLTGTSFGSGIYGDISAMIAALLLDREARTELLDADPSAGSILEPFLRLVRLFRSLEFVPDSDKPFMNLNPDLQAIIGQEPYQMQSAFSFFSPEYRPSGPIGDAALLCPECQQLTGPKSIALMNGFLSLLKYGLDSAYGGFGVGRAPDVFKNPRTLGESTLATGSNRHTPEEEASASAVVNEMATLLTSGRLEASKRYLLEKVYVELLAAGSQRDAYINLQQLLVTTPEFNSNAISESTEDERPQPEEVQPSDEPYKAVVYLMLEGGCDSFNMLVPDECPGSDLVDQYNNERGEIAFSAQERSLRIDASESSQPCTHFAIHPELRVVKELYDDGDLAFFANTGVFGTAPITKSNYFQLTPIQLFAHDTMQREAKVLDVFSEATGTGVLGRLSEVLTDKGYKTNSITIDNPSEAVVSVAGEAPEPLIVSRFGAQEFSSRPESEALDIHAYVSQLNTKTANFSSFFGEAWSEKLVAGLYQAERVTEQLDAATLGGHWPERTEGEAVPELVQKLSIISKLIQTHELRGTDRDFFYTSFGGWDHHRLLKQSLKEQFILLNQALDLFVTELKIQERFDDVTVVLVSEFGRTITPNSGGGSDHAWGGNYFMFGGSVKGGVVRGKYPSNLTPDSPLNLGRGRMLPTTSWDCIWNAVNEWVGAHTEEELDYCLPNRKSTNGSPDGTFTEIFKKDDLFSS